MPLPSHPDLLAEKLQTRSILTLHLVSFQGVRSPELSYNDLVVVDGLVASVEIARLLFVAGRIPPEERDRIRQDLLDYCERDTWAMVKLLESLHVLAGG